MLFYHIRNVIKKQENKARKGEARKMDDNEDGGSDDEAGQIRKLYIYTQINKLGTDENAFNVKQQVSGNNNIQIH